MRTLSGSTLIEVLISMLILSFMLLGLDVIQLNALRQTKAIYYTAIAIQEINLLAEKLTLHNNMPTQIIEQWKKQLPAILPNGDGSIEQVNTHQKISVWWGSQLGSSCKKNIIGTIGCISQNIS